MSNESERIAVHSVQIKQLEDDMKDVKSDIKSIQKTIWIACGVFMTLNVILEIFFKH